MNKSKLINGFTKTDMKYEIIKNYKGRAYDEEIKKCMYLTGEGKKCAVGCFIPDTSRLAQKHMGGAHSLFDRYPKLSKVMPLDASGMRRFQAFHDYLPAKTMGEMLKWIDDNTFEDVEVANG